MLILENSKLDKHSVHRDKSRNKYLGPWHCVVYTSCKPHKKRREKDATTVGYVSNSQAKVLYKPLLEKEPSR